jgi:uncharacterized protein YlxW (UPF0749 family)
MKLNQTSFFVFIASIVMGILISMNLDLSNKNFSVVLDSKQYKEASEEKVRLYGELSSIRKQYEQNLKKLNKYNDSEVTNTEILEEIEKENKTNSILLGTKETTGEGVAITLADGKSFSGTITDSNTLSGLIVHDSDIRSVVNALRNAGAEAISINGQRLLSTSEIYCWGPFVRINGVSLCQPFYINAIGNSEVMSNYLDKEEPSLSILKIRGVQVKLEVSNKIKMSQYLGDIKTDYIQEVEK